MIARIDALPSVVLVDTSIFLNVLDVPGFNQYRNDILSELTQLTDTDANMLLPMAAIIETGNHIAQLSDGGNRRRYPMKFEQQVKLAISGGAPWVATRMPSVEEIAGWLADFPEHAMREISLADLSIIKEWEITCRRHPKFRVKIWTLDIKLSVYDRRP